MSVTCPWVPACAGTSALREDALFAWWKSVSEPVVGSVIEGNCVAVRRGGEQPEMNATATIGQDQPMTGWRIRAAS